MEEIILSCLSKLDICFKFDIVEKHFLLNYLRIFYRSNSNKYCKLELLYNKNKIFLGNSMDLSKTCSVSDEDYRYQIINSVVEYKNYYELKNELSKSPTPRDIEAGLNYFLGSLRTQIRCLSGDNIDIVDVTTSLSPIGYCVIVYKYKGVMMPPITLLIGENNVSYPENEECKKFYMAINYILNGGDVYGLQSKLV